VQREGLVGGFAGLYGAGEEVESEDLHFVCGCGCEGMGGVEVRNIFFFGSESAAASWNWVLRIDFVELKTGIMTREIIHMRVSRLVVRILNSSRLYNIYSEDIEMIYKVVPNIIQL
jgi:hypothetical protein